MRKYVPLNLWGQTGERKIFDALLVEYGTRTTAKGKIDTKVFEYPSPYKRTDDQVIALLYNETCSIRPKDGAGTEEQLMEDRVEIAKLAYRGLTFQARDRLPKNGTKYSNGTTVIIDKHILAKVTIAANRARTELNAGKGPISTGFVAHNTIRHLKYGTFRFAMQNRYLKKFGTAGYMKKDIKGKDIGLEPYKPPTVLRETIYSDIEQDSLTHVVFFKR